MLTTTLTVTTPHTIHRQGDGDLPKGVVGVLLLGVLRHDPRTPRPADDLRQPGGGGQWRPC
jgi:hypothetical protein